MRERTTKAYTPSSTIPGAALATALAAALLLGPAAFAADPPKDPPADAQRTESGLASVVLKEGQGRTPDENDFVAVHFQGWTPAGAKFLDTYGQEKPAVFSLERAFPGGREGILQMKVGEKRRVWIPAHLAPPNPAAGPSGPVIIDIELMGVLPIPNAPEDLTPPKDAQRTSYGVFTKVVEEAPEDAEPQSPTTGAALAHYVLWTSDGRVFDTSFSRQRPTLFPFDKVMPAFADALRQMKVGERRLMWIPENVANGQWQGSPKGMLIFEVELLELMEQDVVERMITKGAPGTDG